VQIKDLSVDYDPLPFTQGRVVAIDSSAGSFDLDIDEGFPLLSEPYFNIESKFGLIIDSTKPQLKANASDHVFASDYTHISGRVWRVTLNPDQRSKLNDMAVGDRYVQMARQGFTTIGILSSRDCGLTNVTLYASASLACALIANEGKITLNNYAIRFRPGTNRLHTTNGDGVHCQQNRVGPTIENCYFEGMADDSINIYTPPCVVNEVKSSTELITSIGGRIRNGDLLQILESATGNVKARVKAKSVVVQDGKYLLVLEEPVEWIKAGRNFRDSDTVFNLSACGAEFVIRNNIMRNHRRHAVLIRAGDGLIEGNTVDNVAGLGIVLTNEPGWPEGPVPWNVVIRNNKFTGCGYSRGYADGFRGASIQVQGIGVDGRLGENRPVQGIKIIGNTFSSPPGAAIYLGATRGAVISGNKCVSKASDKSYRPCASIIIDNCDAVQIENNGITDMRAQVTAAVQITHASAKGGIMVKSLKSTLPAGIPQVLDER
jgi:hypothetical protein